MALTVSPGCIFASASDASIGSPSGKWRSILLNLRGELKSLAFHPGHASSTSFVSLSTESSDGNGTSLLLKERPDDEVGRRVVRATWLLFVGCSDASSDDSSEAEEGLVVSLELELAAVEDLVPMCCTTRGVGRTPRTGSALGDSQGAAGRNEPA